MLQQEYLDTITNNTRWSKKLKNPISQQTYLDTTKSNVRRSKRLKEENIISLKKTKTDSYENKAVWHCKCCDQIDIEILYLSVKDIADLSASDTKYGKGSHSSKFFCICCESTCAGGFNKENILYRTKESIEKQRQIYNQVIEQCTTTKAKEKALQKSKGIKGHKSPATYTCASRIIPPSMHCGMGLVTNFIKHEKKEVEYLSGNVDINAIINEEQNTLTALKGKWRKAHSQLITKLNNGKTTYKTINKECETLKVKANKQKKIIQKLINKKKDIDSFDTNGDSPIVTYEGKMDEYKVYDNTFHKNIEGKQAVKYQQNWNN
eukprot:428492_1